MLTMSPNTPAVDDLPQDSCVGRVPVGMTDGEEDPGALDRFDYGETIGLGRRHRLLEQDVIPKFGCPYRRPGVESVGGRNHRDISQSRAFQYRLPPAENPVFGNTMAERDRLSVLPPWIRHPQLRETGRGARQQTTHTSRPGLPPL